MTSAFNPETRRLEKIQYDWNSMTSDTWADLTNWQEGNPTYGTVSSIGTVEVEFITDIIDLGRITDFNPLCSVSHNGGDLEIEVYVADSIDSSSRLAGDPVFNVTTAGEVLTGQRGRYVQYRILLKNNGDTLYTLNSVNTEQTLAIQQEVISGDSSTHGGTQAARIAPLTREYSKITGVVGNAKATNGITPFVTIGNNTTQAVYTVYDFTAGSGQDSTSQVAIADYTGNVAIEVNDAQTDETEYKWQPSAVRFEDNHSIQFSAPSTSNTYTYEMWMKILQSGGDPGYNHPEYFLRIPVSGGSAIELRTSTDANKLRVDISTNDGSTWTNGAVTGNANDVFRHIAIVGTGSQIKLFVDGTLRATVSSSQTPSGTVQIGDLGGNAGYFWMDDFRISNTQRYSSNFSTPGEFVVDSDTEMLINGLELTVTPIVASSIETVDATVNLLVSGLPKMVSDDNLNIVEVAT